LAVAVHTALNQALLLGLLLPGLTAHGLDCAHEPVDQRGGLLSSQVLHALQQLRVLLGVPAPLGAVEVIHLLHQGLQKFQLLVGGGLGAVLATPAGSGAGALAGRGGNGGRCGVEGPVGANGFALAGGLGGDVVGGAPLGGGDVPAHPGDAAGGQQVGGGGSAGASGGAVNPVFAGVIFGVEVDVVQGVGGHAVALARSEEHV